MDHLHNKSWYPVSTKYKVIFCIKKALKSIHETKMIGILKSNILKKITILLTYKQATRPSLYAIII